MSEPISPKPVTSIAGDGLPAYLSNGVVGLRVRDQPLRNGVASLSGLDAEHPLTGVVGSPLAPYPLAGDLRVGGVWLSDAPQSFVFRQQVYDFGRGELTTSFDVVINEVTARVEVVTFCSRTQPSVVLQEISLQLDRSGDVSMAAVIDPTDVPGGWLHRLIDIPEAKPEEVDGALHWATLGDRASCGLAYATEMRATNCLKRTVAAERDRPLRTTYEVRVRARERIRLRQFAALVPSASHHQPHQQAVRLVALGRRIGFEELRRENTNAWSDLWKGRVLLEGAGERWQALADAAFFYLNSSVHPSSLASTHIFGLAQWYNYHYYYGHVMWDLEAFVLPPLLLTQPDAARAMLDFRTRTVEAARQNARLYGYRGLQFPWEASAARGEEAAPGSGTAAAYEHHVSLDVALAFARYGHATGDQDFVHNNVWPILSGVARWIESRVVATPRGFEIRRAMGIAERAEPSDNVAFVNMAAVVVLREAIDCAKRTGHKVPRQWAAIADGIVIPLDHRTNVIRDHDGYRVNEEKGATPAAMAGLFPLGYAASADIERATTAFYVTKADDYIGSPMLSALYASWCARVGDRKNAMKFLDSGYAQFVDDRFLNTHEYRSDKFPEQPQAGPFYANIGGFLINCLYGFTGIDLGPDAPQTWCKRPVVLPEGWDAIVCERVWARESPHTLEARQGDAHATISPRHD